MEGRIFTAEKLNFKSRMMKGIGINILAFLFLCSIILFPSGNNKYGISEILFILFFFSIIFIRKILLSINYIYELNINATEVKISGLKFDVNWEKQIAIKNVNIKIVERRLKFGRIEGYMIDLIAKEKRYRINKLYNWNNFTLYESFKTFKSAKDEKIIIDEKFLIDAIEKRAKENFEWQNN
jgi:hypothetical protein